MRIGGCLYFIDQFQLPAQSPEVNRNRLQLSSCRITRCGLWYCFLSRESVRCSDVYGPESLLAITNACGFVTCARNWEFLSARAYCSGAGAASQDRRLFGAFVPVS